MGSIDLRGDGTVNAHYAPRRIGHINLFINDLAHTMDFLHYVCGFFQTGRISKIGSAFVSTGNTHHDIGMIEVAGYQKFAQGKNLPGPADRGSRPGLNHFGWEMESEAELVDAYVRAKDAGLGPRVTNNGTAFSNYLFDPGGLQHQFYADNVKEWWSVYTGGEVDLHREATWVPGEMAPRTDPLYVEHPTIKRVEHAPLHPLRLTHAVMLYPDIPDALAFYRETAGMRVVHQVPDQSVYYLAGKASHCDLVIAPTPDGMDSHRLHHATFEVFPEDDLGEARSVIEKMQVEIVDHMTLPHKESLVIRAPDDFLFEFRQVRDGQLPDSATLGRNLLAA